MYIWDMEDSRIRVVLFIEPLALVSAIQACLALYPTLDVVVGDTALRDARGPGAQMPDSAASASVDVELREAPLRFQITIGGTRETRVYEGFDRLAEQLAMLANRRSAT